MEIIVLAWFLTLVTLDNEIQGKQTQIDMLMAESALRDYTIDNMETSIDDMENTIFNHNGAIVKTATAHSAFYAGQQLKNDEVNERLDALEADKQ